MSYTKNNFVSQCSYCGGILESDRLRFSWVEETCTSCGNVESHAVNMADIIEQAESTREIFGF